MRALTIGVEQFAAPHAQLTFAPKLAGEMGEALAALGYEVTVRAEQQLPSRELGTILREHLEAPDASGLLIIHVVTHGRADKDETVYLLGSDAEIDDYTDIASRLRSVQNASGRPFTLFLLDLCQGGTVARLPWQAQESEDSPTRGWVIAACRGDELAYDGRFTRALITVLQRLATRELGIDAAVRHVPLDTVAKAIRREVNRLIAIEDGAYSQHVTANLVDISAELPDMAFFPNPAFTGDPGAQLRAGLDEGLRPFLADLVLSDVAGDPDAREPMEADGPAELPPGGEPDPLASFAGRARQLRRLSPWLNGVGDTPLFVVTGSPGAGKSALLRVLVCAAHPELRERTRGLWGGIAQSPQPVADLAAVHAQSRDLDTVARSLARQLGLPAPAAARDLVLAVQRMHRCPVIVIDAMDAADDPAELMSGLLLPLASARRPDGGPAARLLVGVRRQAEFDSLLTVAHAIGGCIDLDDVPADILENDLYQYVSDMLRAKTPYRADGAGVGAFAAGVSRTLSQARGRRQGQNEFLLAALYTRNLLAARPQPAADPAETAHIGRGVPTSLPQMLALDLDLADAGNVPLNREVFAALGFARGKGMPLSVLTRVVDPYAQESGAVQRALEAGRPYLRQATDIDGTTLFRLADPELADGLMAGPLGLFDRLLAALGPPDARNWKAAEPYVLRHVLDYAATQEEGDAVLNDPGFLLEAPPSIILPVLTGTRGEAYRAALRGSSRQLRVDREALALSAARAGLTDLADGLAAVPGAGVLGWRPRWVAGTAEASPDSSEFPAIVVTSDGGTLQIWNLATRKPVGAPMTYHVPWLHPAAIGQLEGRPVAVTGGPDGAVQLWDLTDQEPLGTPVTLRARGTTAVAAGHLGHRPIAVTGDEDGTIRVFDLYGTQHSGYRMGGHDGKVSALAIGQIDDRTVAVSVGHDAILMIWDLRSEARVLHGRHLAGRLATGHRGEVPALAIGRLGERTIAVTGGQDGTLRMWDLRTRKRVGWRPIASRQGEVQALATGKLNGRDIVVAGGRDGTVRIWDLGSRRSIGEMSGHRGAVMSVTVGVLNGRQVAVTGGADGAVRIWDLGTQRPMDPLAADHGHGVAVSPIFRMRARRSGVSRVALDPGRHEGPMANSVTFPIRALAIAQVSERWIAVLGGDGGNVAVVEMPTGEQCLEVPSLSGSQITAVTCSQVAGQPVAALTADGSGCSLLDLHTGEPILTGEIKYPLLFPGRKPAGAVIVLDGSLVKVYGGTDGTVTVQDKSGSSQLPAQHDGAVTAVACQYLGHRPFAFTGGQDGKVRVWDLSRRTLADIIDVPGPVFAVEATDVGDLLVGAAGEAIAFRRTDTPLGGTDDRDRGNPRNWALSLPNPCGLGGSRRKRGGWRVDGSADGRARRRWPASGPAAGAGCVLRRPSAPRHSAGRRRPGLP